MNRGQVTEALEAGSIVVSDEAVEEGVSIFVGGEESPGDAAFWFAADGFDDAAVEAFDKPIGLRAIGSCQAMGDFVSSAEAIERMPPGGLIGRLVLHVDREAISELSSVVGKNGVNRVREVGQETTEEFGCSAAVSFGMNLEVDVAGRPIDGDEGVALAPLQSRQMLEIDMNEANGRLLEDTDRRLFWLGPLVKAVTHQATMNGAAGEFGIEAAAHHLDDIVEGQLQSRSQLTDEGFLNRRQAGDQDLGRVREVVHSRAPAPAPDRGLAHSQFVRQRGNRRLAALNISRTLGVVVALACRFSSIGRGAP